MVREGSEFEEESNGQDKKDSDRAKFGAPETKYQDARACVTGKGRELSGEAEDIATGPSQ
jgi:hypothetical protein